MPVRAALKRRVVEELKRHQTTRRFVDPGPTFEDECLGEDELRLRADAEWQRGLVEALAVYAEASRDALQRLSEAHSALLDAGVGDAKGASFISDVLAACLEQAEEQAAASAESLAEELKVHRAGLELLSSDLDRADSLAGESRRYREKVAALRDTMRGGGGGNGSLRRVSSTSASPVAAPTSAALVATSGDKFAGAEDYSRLKRNERKYAAARAEAESARAKAGSSLRSCANRRDGLCRLATSTVEGVAAALTCAAPASLSGGGGRASFITGAHAGACEAPAAAAAAFHWPSAKPIGPERLAASGAALLGEAPPAAPPAPAKPSTDPEAAALEAGAEVVVEPKRSLDFLVFGDDFSPRPPLPPRGRSSRSSASSLATLADALAGSLAHEDLRKAASPSRVSKVAASSPAATASPAGSSPGAASSAALLSGRRSGARTRTGERAAAAAAAAAAAMAATAPGSEEARRSRGARAPAGQALAAGATTPLKVADDHAESDTASTAPTSTKSQDKGQAFSSADDLAGDGLADMPPPPLALPRLLGSTAAKGRGDKAGDEAKKCGFDAATKGFESPPPGGATIVVADARTPGGSAHSTSPPRRAIGTAERRPYV